MITVNGYKAFHGVMRIHPKSKCVPVIDKKGDWLYKPKADAWYCDDISYPAKFCVVVSDDSEKLIPKKPTPHKVDVEKIKIGNANWCKGTTVYYCPNCKKFISRTDTYCHECGQALDWSAI